MSQFDDMYWLVSVVEAGSFTIAAERNGVTGAAVSKRIRLMEERLGVKLLVRNTRSLRMTEAGELYYKRGRQLIDEFNMMEHNVSSTSERLCGTIRLNAPLAFGVKKLMQPLHRFMQLHPEIQIVLHLEDRFIDVHTSDYDLIIRIGSLLPDSSFVAQRLTTHQIICCASPNYLAQHPTPTTPDELVEHHCLRYEPTELRDGWAFKYADGWRNIPVVGSFISNSGDAIREMALQGQGVCLSPTFIVEQELAQGSLVQLLTDYPSLDIHVYAMYQSRHFLPLKIARLVEFLKVELNSATGSS